MVWNASQILTVESMHVGLTVIALLGFAFTVLLNLVEGKILP
jgi:ABC-type nitrate/sulfonate/bicarbonate transport system permease component